MRFLLTAFLGATVLSACNDHVVSPSSNVLFRVGATVGQGVIRGQVVGRTFSSDSTLSESPITGARVDAFLFSSDSSPVDSLPGDSLPPQPVLVASTITGGRGQFQINKLQAGLYLLLATPPAGSPFAPGTETVMSGGIGVVNVRILLSIPLDSIPGDSTPPTARRE